MLNLPSISSYVIYKPLVKTLTRSLKRDLLFTELQKPYLSKKINLIAKKIFSIKKDNFNYDKKSGKLRNFGKILTICSFHKIN